MASIKKMLYISTLLIFLLSSCSVDKDDISRDYDIEGKWRLESINTYDLDENLIDTKTHNYQWKVTQDSIELTQHYGYGYIIFNYAYKIYPNGTFIYGNSEYIIQSLTSDEFIFGSKRSDHRVEYIFLSTE